jgi:hypothetical protein
MDFLNTGSHSIKAVSRAFSIPRGTLQLYLKGAEKKSPVSNRHVPGKTGCYSTFDTAFETELETCALNTQQLYNGITSIQL